MDIRHVGRTQTVSASLLDKGRLKQAFELLGQDLARRQKLVEIAVYGGSAIMLQFAWRRTTEDVDAVVRQGYDETAIKPSLSYVADCMDLPPDWLNNAVGMFTPLKEEDTLFDLAGSYPANGQPGLRVLVAKPHYLLAMKLRALSNLDRGDRDLLDARALARELRLTDVEDLRKLYISIHDEDPHEDVLRHFPSVLKAS